MMSAAPASASSYANGTPITIADGGPAPAAGQPFAPGPGSPYPSEIAVAGTDGTLTHVTVTLGGVSHTRPDDLDVMVEGPNGQRVVLLSDSGETNPVSGYTVAFDDAAASAAPDSTELTAGSYRPTNNFGGYAESGDDAFAPGAPGPPRASALDAAFGGVSANGTWRLWVVDDRPDETGSISQGWSITVSTTGSGGDTGTGDGVLDDGQAGAGGGSPDAGGPPHAFYTGPSTVAARRRITLDASETSSTPGAVLRWDVNSDGRTDASCRGPQTELQTVFTAAGDRKVSLTVADPQGRTDTFSSQIRVGAAGARIADLPRVRASDVFVCKVPSEVSVYEDLTPFGGPLPVCSTSVQYGSIDAIGCLQEVTDPAAIPAAEAAIFSRLAEARLLDGFRPSFPGAGAARAISAPTPPRLSDAPYLSTSAVRINGIDIVPIRGGAVLVVPKRGYVISSQAYMSVAGHNLACPGTCSELVLYLPAKFKPFRLGDFEGDGRKMGGLKLRGATVDMAARRADVHLRLELPLGGRQELLTAEVDAPATNGGGLQLDGAALRLRDPGRYGNLSISDVAARFGKEGGRPVWRGTASVASVANTGPNWKVPSAEFVLRDGQLGLRGSGGGGDADSVDVRLDRDVLSGDIAFRLPPGPRGLAATVAGAFTQELDGVGRIRLDHARVTITGPGGVDARFTDAKFDMRTTLSAPGILPGGTELVWRVSEAWVVGRLQDDLLAPVIPEGIIQQGLELSFVQDPRSATGMLLNGFEGYATVQPPLCIPGECVELTGGADPHGFFACGRLQSGWAVVGVARPWGQRARLMEGSCDFSAYRPRRTRLARTSAAAFPVTLGADLPIALIAVHGADAPPIVSISGPGGAHAELPADGSTVSNDRFLLFRNPADNTTYIELRTPAAGTWTVTPTAGSPAVTAVDQADGVAPPTVTGKVTGSGRTRTLRYRVTGLGEQTVRFAQAGPGRQPIGVAKGSRGTIDFVVAAGRPTARRVLATSEFDARVRSSTIVAKFTAPAVRRLAATRHVRVDRAASAATVRWTPVRGASKYEVYVSLEDGRRFIRSTSATRRVLRIRPIGSRVGGTVRIAAVPRTGVSGPARSARIRARPTRRDLAGRRTG